ncbi:MAG: NAD(+) synthase, partial [Verrucomicrobiota bacterium]
MDCSVQLEDLARRLPADAVVVVGCPVAGTEKPFNAAVIFHRGTLQGIYRKRLLPNYGVFDEKRVFEAGAENLIVDVSGCRVGLHLCEDSWYDDEAPLAELADEDLSVLLNLSASPYFKGKRPVRREILGKAARRIQAPVAYCNLVGGQDELVFDGASMVLSPTGERLAQAKAYTEEILRINIPVKSMTDPNSPADLHLDLPLPETSVVAPQHPEPEDLKDVYLALELGLRDYVEKNGFKKVLIAISGGIDSALVAALAVDALGPERVVGVTMPSRFSSSETLSDAELLGNNLGITFHTVPIRELHQTYLDNLSPLWEGREPDVTEENIQARIRGNIIMALSNTFGWLVLTTGNKSELATGYCTLYGDMAGGFAVIKDVPKTLVFDLSRWRNRQGDAP